jgi:hypothetical protein
MVSWCSIHPVEAVTRGETRPYDDVHTFICYKPGDRGNLVRTMRHGRFALVVWEKDKAQLPRCVAQGDLQPSAD